jgi:hypothetical protein
LYRDNANVGDFLINHSDAIENIRINNVKLPGIPYVCSYTQHFYFDADKNINLLYPKFSDTEYAASLV